MKEKVDLPWTDTPEMIQQRQERATVIAQLDNAPASASPERQSEYLRQRAERRQQIEDAKDKEFFSHLYEGDSYFEIEHPPWFPNHRFYSLVELLKFKEREIGGEESILAYEYKVGPDGSRTFVSENVL